MTAHPLRFRPSVERLADRLTPDATAGWMSDWAVVLAGEDGGVPDLTLFDRSGNTHTLTAFDPAFRGGVRYASGDVTGDGADDLVVAAGPGGGPHVKVFDGQTGTVVRSFFAYNPAFGGGIELAVGDVNRDGFDDIITGAGAGGGPHVRVFDGRGGGVLTEFMAFEPIFRGGVFVAAGDLNRDGYDDVIVGAGAGAGPRVIARDGLTAELLVNFFPFETNFRGGVRVAAADLTGDGIDEVITAAGPSGGPRVRTFDVTTGTTVSDRFVADTNYTGGVRLSKTELSRDGTADVVAKTRTGDAVSARVYSLDGSDWEYRVWVGTGAPPADFQQYRIALGWESGRPDPVRTLTGVIESVSTDGTTMTVRRGNGTLVTVDLDGNPPPPGQFYIDTFDVVADLVIGDDTLTPSELPVGRWVRVTTYHHDDPSATIVKASQVRVL